jgi:hypothetical protein
MTTAALRESGRAPMRGKSSLRRSWYGFLAPAVAWAAHLQIGYALTGWVCRHGGIALLHSVSLAALILSVSGGWIAWRTARTLASEVESGPDSRRILNVLGIAGSVLFSVVITAQWIAVLSLDPCP